MSNFDQVVTQWIGPSYSDSGSRCSSSQVHWSGARPDRRPSSSSAPGRAAGSPRRSAPGSRAPTSYWPGGRSVRCRPRLPTNGLSAICRVPATAAARSGGSSTSLIATCRGRVTTYAIASAMSTSASRSMSANRCCMTGQDLRSVVAGQLGGDGARLDQRHADVALGDLLAERLAERADGMLGGVVDPAVQARHPAGDGGDVHQVGDVARPLLRGGQQVGKRGVRHRQGAPDVHLEHPVPLLDRRVDDRAEQHHPGVVDHDVEPAELVDGSCDRGGGLVAVGDVSLDRHDPYRQAVQLVRQLVEPIRPARDHGDIGAQLGQPGRGGPADPAGGARDQSDGSGEGILTGCEVGGTMASLGRP